MSATYWFKALLAAVWPPSFYSVLDCAQIGIDCYQMCGCFFKDQSNQNVLTADLKKSYIGQFGDNNLGQFAAQIWEAD